MAKGTRAKLISELISSMCDRDIELYGPMIDYLLELGYTPQKQKVQGYVLAFRNNCVKQTIAKIGVSTGKDRRATLSVKFYACKHPPQKFRDAVQKAIESTNMQYRCCGCNACGAHVEDRGYRYMTPAGEEFIRCGAYVVRIPDLAPDDVDDLRSLLLEQHEYFLARPK